MESRLLTAVNMVPSRTVSSRLSLQFNGKEVVRAHRSMLSWTPRLMLKLSVLTQPFPFNTVFGEIGARHIFVVDVYAL